MSERKKLAIIDGKSVFYRGYYSMPSLSLPDGTPTGGVYGFAVMALELIKKLDPDYVVVAWDKPKTNIRKRVEMYPKYKAGRKPAPPDFYAQIPYLRDMLKAFSWPLYELDDYEADDIMCTLAKKADKAGLETMLVTSDLDALQCLSPHTHVYALKKGFSNIERFDLEYFEKKHGIRTDQFLDLKSLKGDSSDNIPGVPGVGEKTAVELLQKYDTLDGVYKHLDELKPTLKAKLEAGKDSAYLSKKVALLLHDAPVPLDLKASDTKDLDVHALKNLLQKLEFRSLLRQLPDYMRVLDGEVSLVRGDAVPIDGGKVTHINTDKELDAADFGKPTELVMASYCAARHGRAAKLLIISPEPKKTYVLLLAKLSVDTLRNKLTPLLEHVPAVGYDIKSTLKALIGLKLPLPAVSHDVLVGTFLLNSLRREQSLTDLAASDLGYEGSTLDDLSPEDLATKAGEVTAVIWELKNQQAAELNKLPTVAKLAKDIEWPVIEVLARMEYEGIKLDIGYLAKMSDEFEDLIQGIEQEIYGHADQEFNISSPQQLADILYVKLNLPTLGVKKGKTGFSTGANELARLRGLHPIVDLITQYREYTKLKNTYIDTLPKLIDDQQRVHTTFNLTIAQTGRLSSIDPNLQNIPVRTELGKRIRKAFIAKAGHSFVSADYSQFELRLAAVFSDDKEMIELFNEDADIHTQTAAQVYSVKPADVTPDMRRNAKVVNFGILYGMSPHGLSVATGMSMLEAKQFIDKYFEIRKPLLDYINHLKKLALEQGYIETLFGRRRPTPDVHSSNYMVREAAYRQAINMPAQGTEADLMKMAMIELDKQLPKGAKQLLQIHDSIIVEAPDEAVDEVAQTMKKTMENVYKLPVRLTVDIHSGKNWGEL